MESLVIYDSNHGNTRKIAETVAEILGAPAVSVSDAGPEHFSGLGLVVVGSPILGWKPSERTQAFLAALKKEQLKGVKAAAFDTRVKLFIHGDAAGKIAKVLADAGAEMISEPQPFYVKGKEGPLFEGEIEKARAWAVEIKRASSRF